MTSSARYSALAKPAAPGEPARPTLEMTFRGHRRDICCAAFQPNFSLSSSFVSSSASPLMAPRLLTAGADGAVMLWDARPTNRALRFVGHRGPVLGCDSCPSSVAGASVSLLASCGTDGYARLWVPNLRRTAATHTTSYLVQQQQRRQQGDGNGAAWRAHTGAARAVKFAQDGSNHLYTAGDDKSVKVWDLHYVASTSSYPAGEPLVTFRSSRFLGNFSTTAASVPGRSSSSGGGGGAAKGTFKSSRSHANWVRCLAVQKPVGSGSYAHYLASGGDDNTVLVWDTRSPHSGPAHAFYEHRAAVKGLSFHGNGYHLAACDASGAINIFDLRQSSSSYSSSSSAEGVARHRYGLLQHYRDAHGCGGVAVNDVCFAPSTGSNSSWLLSAGDDGTAKLWDTVEGFLYCTVQAHQGPVRTVNFTDDGAYFVTAGHDGIAMVWRSGLMLGRQPQGEQEEQDSQVPHVTLEQAAVTAPALESKARSAPSQVAPRTAAVHNYSYYDGEEDPSGQQEEEEDVEDVEDVEVEERTAAVEPPRREGQEEEGKKTRRGKPTAAAGAVDQSYLAWQRAHAGVVEGDSPKPSNSHKKETSWRPPLPPTASPPRERSFERSEERYSHISSPQKELEARAYRQQQPQQGLDRAQTRPPLPPPPPSHNVSSAPSYPEEAASSDAGKYAKSTDKDKGSGSVSEQQRRLAERRLENVENAVASLVEYVQEENAHRDRELTRMRDAVEQRHGRQREDIVALKAMMEQLLTQQAMLLGQLKTEVAGGNTAGTATAAPVAASQEAK